MTLKRYCTNDFLFIQPLLAKDHSTEIIPPVLLPGETLILQQDKVTCINTLCRAATGALHLTNYRIIFTGVYMQVCEIKNYAIHFNFYNS